MAEEYYNRNEILFENRDAEEFRRHVAVQLWKSKRFTLAGTQPSVISEMHAGGMQCILENIAEVEKYGENWEDLLWV